LSALLFIGIGLQLVNPQIIRYFIDTASSGAPRDALLSAALLFITISLLQKGVALLGEMLAQDVGWNATNALRRDLALHCLRLDLSFHKLHTPGELIERVDGDVTALANYFSRFVIQIMGNCLLIVGILALLFREDLQAGAVLAVYALAVLAVLAGMQNLGVSRWAAARESAAQQYGFIEERISGAEEIRALGAEPYVLSRLSGLMSDFLEKFRLGFVVNNLIFNLTRFLFAAGYAIGLALGALLYSRGEASLGTAYLVVSYIGMLSGPLINLQEQVQDFQHAAGSIGRIQALFTIQPAVQEPGLEGGRAALKLPVGPLSVQFRQVSFSYAEDGASGNVLEGVSFRLEPGKVLGILGRTGSGKSTLTRLLFRLYDPTLGEVCLGGTDIRQVPLANLRLSIGMVTQDVQLFQATVRDNLVLFNSDIRAADLRKALEDLRLWGWIESLPQGLDTPLAPGGQGLSAGEAQLLAFARVFLKDPGLVILDEASSRLDPVTESLLERAVDRLFQDRTAVIIAHRLQTVQRADEILILENGRVAEYGSRRGLASNHRSRFYSLLQAGLEETLV
jgi:ABC-type multidrug transport system fused ATPase/permease subunit